MGRRFVSERRRDPYYRAAQREGLRSRAAFKLAYLADRYPLFAPGDRVLDLGAAPGGWSLVALERVAPRGTVVAVDPRPLEPIDGVEYLRARVGDPQLLGRLGPRPFDVVISDLSPRISGAYATDHARSVDLVWAASELAHAVLRSGGRFVAKLFDGELRGELEAKVGRHFDRLVRTKPTASREQSSEIYLVAWGHHRGGGRPRVPERDEAPRPDI